jgi:hypothetical protein
MSQRGNRVDVARTVFACVSRLQVPVMDHLLTIRNELTAPGLPGDGAKYAFLYTSGWFVMWVEGSDEAVDFAVQRVAGDPRNEDQKLLHQSHGRAGLRERIVVATTQTPLRPTEFARWVLHMRDEGPSLEPVDIWNRLGAPCLIDSSSRPCTRPLRQYVLVAADDHGPVDQLRELGERFNSPVVYQRMGLPRRHSPDMGMAYVDVPVEGGAARVRVVPGRAMAQASVRNSMPSTDAIVLISGNRPGIFDELAMRIAELRGRLANPPPFYLAGEPEAVKGCARMLHDLGIGAKEMPVTRGRRIDLLALVGTPRPV